MTELVARSGSARRVVRVAAALLAGQALLGVAVGWVILGGRDDGRPTVPTRLGPVSDRPLALPQMPDGVRSTPVPKASSESDATGVPKATSEPDATVPAGPRGGRGDSTAGGATGPAPARTTPRAPGDPTVAPLPPLKVDPSTAESSPGVPVTPSSAGPTTGSTAPTAVLGDRCNQRNQVRLTATGVEVRCLPDRGGVLRWQRNEDG